MENREFRYYESICRQNQQILHGDTKLRHWFLYFGLLSCFLWLYTNYSLSIQSYISSFPVSGNEMKIMLMGIVISVPICLAMFFPSGVRKFIETVVGSILFIGAMGLLSINIAVIITFLEPTTWIQEIENLSQLFTNNQIGAFGIDITTWHFLFFFLQSYVFFRLSKGCMNSYNLETKIKYWVYYFLSYFVLFSMSCSPLLIDLKELLPLFFLFIVAYKVYQYYLIYKKKYPSGISSGILFFDILLLISIFYPMFC